MIWTLLLMRNVNVNGDQELQRLARNNRRGNLELGAEDIAVDAESIFSSSFVITVDDTRDLRSFEIRFDFEWNFRFGIRFVVMIRFDIFESSTPSIVLCKETIGGG